MLDISDLLIGIISKAKADTSGNLTPLTGYFIDLAPGGQGKPFCTLSVIPNPVQLKTMGTASAPTMTRQVVQLSVRASTASQANSISKALGVCFHRQTITLLQMEQVLAETKTMRCNLEGKDIANPVYHASVDVEFWVQS